VTTETPTGRMRYLMRSGPQAWAHRVLQQEWQVTTGNGKARAVTFEWRDVPHVELEGA